MAIDKNSKAYQSLLNKWYTDEQINQMASAVAWWQSAKDVIANTKVGNTTPTTSTTNSTNTWSQWSSSNYKDSDWYYSATERNMATWWAEFWWSKTTTTPTATSEKSSADKLREAWDKYSYEEQQDILKKNKNIQATLDKYWITNKAATTQETPTTSWTSTSWSAWKWDYQDSSEGRMYEIADNLNNYRVTNPNLFNDWDTFSNFFIAGKNRSQEQLNYLKDYFNAVKRYNSLDNMTADAVGSMLTRWEVPDDYLNYLKYADPNRYAAVMDAKARATDKIKDSASMDTIKWMEWDDDTTTWKSIEWLKSQWLFLDKDWNLVDDRRENYASEEEKTYLKQLADLAAANLDIDNTVKHTYEDYVKQYPWATKATLMAMAQDVNADLLREKENNLVEMTRLQGYVNYMQSERQEMNKAGADTIAQLEKDFGMYYTYTPEWISELTQAKYAATNITLDQADEWTDTQKQMALKQVLDWYYERYGEIIQRPEEQVINDVMKVARDEWISLSAALEKNFLSYLRQKPQYQALASWQKSEWKLWQWKNWELFFYDAATQSVVPFTVDGKTTYTDTADRTQRQKLFSTIVDNNSSIHNIGSTVATTFRTWNIGWSCWEFANDYSLAMIGRKVFWDLISEKPVNSQEATVWSCIVFDWTNKDWTTANQKKYGHVWIVTWISADGKTLHIVDSNFKWDWKIKQYDINVDEYAPYIKWYYDFQQESWIPQVSPWTYNADKEKLYAEIIKTWSKRFTDESNKDSDKLIWMLWVETAQQWYDDALERWNEQNLAEVTNLVNSIDYMINALDSWAVKDTKSSKFKSLDNWKTYFNKDYWDFMTHYDYVYNVLWMKQMQNLKSASVTFWSTTEWEWAKVYNTIAAMSKEKMSPKALAESLWKVKQQLIDTTKWRYVVTNNETMSLDEMIKWTEDEYTTWWSFEGVFWWN